MGKIASKESAGPVWRDRIARLILILAAIGAVVSFGIAAPDAEAAPPEYRMIAVWQWYGYLVFAGLFALLAWRPRRFPGVWELAIGHKLALSLTALVLGRAAGPDAMMLAISDGILTALLIIAYVLSRAYMAWRG